MYVIPAFRSRIARKALFTSRVKIDDERPYLIPFETRIASSTSRTLITADGRAEDLLLGDPHLGIDVAEDRRPVVEALVEPVAGGDLAAGEERRALVLADRRVRVDLLERGLVDDRADVRVLLPADSEPELLGRAHEPRGELVVDALLRDHAARGGAALAGSAERRPEDALDGEVEVGVVEHDDRVLAAELEVDVLQAVGCVLRHLDAGLARAGERDHRHVGVGDDRVPDLSPAPVDDVDDAAGDAGLDQQLDEALRRGSACRSPA